MLKVKNKIFP